MQSPQKVQLQDRGHCCSMKSHDIIAIRLQTFLAILKKANCKKDKNKVRTTQELNLSCASLQKTSRELAAPPGEWWRFSHRSSFFLKMFAFCRYCVQEIPTHTHREQPRLTAQIFLPTFLHSSLCSSVCKKNDASSYLYSLKG